MADEVREQDVKDASQPLTFTAEEAGSTVAMTAASGEPAVTLEYTTNGGQTWLPFVVGETVVTLAEIGAKVSIRAGEAGNERMSYSGDGDYYRANTFALTGSLSASGSVDSLLTQDPVAYAAGVQLSEGCYARLFYNCTALKSAPVLPSTKLGIACYDSMFWGTGITVAPALPATTLANACYTGMFAYCSSLTVAPALPATTLANACYTGMFSDCSSLTAAPALPATTLANACYNSMFWNCKELEQAPALPATTLSDFCYISMFTGCTHLKQAPALPATALAKSCYDSMFAYCTSLTKAPALPATTLVDSCYHEMFSGCSSLSYLIVGFKAWADDVGATLKWVEGVPQSGEFHCRRGLPRIYDDSHIPGPAPASK